MCANHDPDMQRILVIQNMTTTVAAKASSDAAGPPVNIEFDNKTSHSKLNIMLVNFRLCAGVHFAPHSALSGFKKGSGFELRVVGFRVYGFINAWGLRFYLSFGIYGSHEV